MGLVASFRRNWRLLLVFAAPLALSFLLINSGTQTSKCAFMMGICTVFWVTEALPLPVTSVLPIMMAPVLGVLTSNEVCKNFFNDMCIMVIGAIFVGGAVEHSNLHRRIALRLLLLIGVQPRRLLFSIVSITGFLSMWIANTVATSMMAPIVQTLIEGQMEAKRAIKINLRPSDDHVQLVDKETEREEHKPLTELNGDGGHHDMEATTNGNGHRDPEDHEALTLASNKDPDDDDQSDEGKQIKKIFNIAICYSANIGGIGTLLGTPPNLVLAKTVADLAYDGKAPITYTSWLQFGMPVCLLSMVVAFAWMNVAAFGFKSTFTCKATSTKNEDKLMRKVIQKQYDDLGSMSFHEKVVCGHFALLLVLFITRQPGFITGWGSFFPPKYVKDSVSAMAVAASLFVWPKCRPQAPWSKDFQVNPEAHEAALDWKTAAGKFPWGLLFLFGGGFVLAHASKMSGLSGLLVEYLSFVSALPPWVTVLILTTLTCLITEITSNTVITIITLPILGDLAMKFGVNPLLYMLPVTAAASMAFMLPVATPPNAIIHALGMVKLSEMIKSGFTMNILGIVCINIVVNTVGYWAFSLDTMPSWVMGPDDVIGNVTTMADNSTTLFNIIGNNISLATNESAFI